ncbi:hypothetical protein [Halocynthiibacter namhaensis]|uniref:hypothetical protein n=1 Tax=Halocynthiibacter namhaensis TaxID=1290553 RepID=UPI0012E0957E|nr:hypothetical protein [Halocynthiibacter namhaensis]
MRLTSGSPHPKSSATDADSFPPGGDISTAHTMANLASVLDSLADLCAVIQSDIGSDVSEIPELSDSMISHLQNIDRLQQNLEDLSTFHSVFSKICGSTTLSLADHELLEKYMVLSSLKSRIFARHLDEPIANTPGAIDLF